MGVSILQVLMLLVLVVILYGAVVHVLVSDRSHGGAKFGWFLATILAPILAYIFFLITTQPTVDAAKIENDWR